jgi:hypothetical protein
MGGAAQLLLTGYLAIVTANTNYEIAAPIRYENCTWGHRAKGGIHHSLRVNDRNRLLVTVTLETLARMLSIVGVAKNHESSCVGLSRTLWLGSPGRSLPGT